MIQIKIQDKDIQLATSLRVIYELKNMMGCKTLQAAIKQVSQLDIDSQIKLLYAAYKYGGNLPEDLLSETEFTGLILDNLGMIKIGNLLTDIVDGFMYAGLTEEEKERAKKATAEEVKKQTQAGATSSDTDIE